MTVKKSVFETLSAINVNDKVEKKKNLTYLSWAWAWGEVKKAYPNATYSVIYNTEGQPWTYDEHLGYLVQTAVTIEGETLQMWLPVMDGANKAMMAEAYDYTTRYGDKTCEGASMFDINKSLMRCLVKNLAMFGMGHYIYAGEDLPENEETPKVAVKPPTTAKAKFTPEIPQASTHIPLELKTENWAKAMKWIIANKAKGMEEIVRVLSQRYTISDAVKDEIKKKL